jgi:hypothetical protein
MSTQFERQQPAVGVFASPAEAEFAVTELRRNGFRDDQIGVTGRDWRESDEESSSETYAEEGAVAGITAGAGVGALWGLGIITGVMPVIGPAIAAGTAAAILSSAVAGAAAVGLAGMLVGLGMSKDEANFYESEAEAGQIVVTVSAGPRVADATLILRSSGGYDYSSRRVEAD